jgi:signal transduction histidine kinase
LAYDDRNIHINFPRCLWQIIEDNGFSRVYLVVHWSFDAFALDAAGKLDVTQNIGGVPLGLTIAEDIFAAGHGKAPAKSKVGPRNTDGDC